MHADFSRQTFNEERNMQVDYSRHMTRRQICSQITLDRQITRRDIGRHIKYSRYRDNYERDRLTEYVNSAVEKQVTMQERDVQTYYSTVDRQIIWKDMQTDFSGHKTVQIQ